MKFIKCLGNVLYSLILLFILISGICNMSTFIGRLGIGFGSLDYIITISCQPLHSICLLVILIIFMELKRN